MCGVALRSHRYLCGPFDACQLRILDLDLILKVLLRGLKVNRAVKVILEAALEGLVAALIVRTGVGHIDLGCSLCKQSDVVLAAEEVGLVIAVGDLVHGLFVVGVVLRILGNLGHDVGITGQRVHDILDRGDAPKSFTVWRNI